MSGPRESADLPERPDRAREGELAEPGDGDGQDQHQRTGGEADQAADQRARGTVAIDHEAGRCLSQGRDREQGRHDETEFGVAVAEFLAQPGKQRREYEVEKMADQVRVADYRDDAGIVTQRHCRRDLRGHGQTSQSATRRLP